MYNEEHFYFVTAIRINQRLNQIERLIETNLCGIMGGESAITGKVIIWVEMMGSDLRLDPAEYSFEPD